MSISIDELPQSIRASRFFSKEDLHALCSIDVLPAIDASFTDDQLKNIVQYYAISPEEMEKELHRYAVELLSKGKINDAWQILLSAENC